MEIQALPEGRSLLILTEERVHTEEGLFQVKIHQKLTGQALMP